MCFIVKYALLITNFIITLAGLALIGLGIAVLVNTKSLSEASSAVPVVAIPIAVIVLGAVIFLIAFFGCCGSMKENRCLLIMYAICMVLLAGGKIYLSVLIFNNSSSLRELVQDWVGDAFRDQELRSVFHEIETTFQCCGTTGPDSYTGILASLPASCCPESTSQCVSTNAFDGCFNVVTDFVEKYGDVFGAVLTTVLVIELVGMLFAIFLSCNITSSKRRNSV